MAVEFCKTNTTIGCLLLVYILPSAYGIITIKKLHPSSAGTTGALNIGVIQPNVDPWEKWGLDPSDRIQSYLCIATRLLCSCRPSSRAFSS